MDSLKKLNLIIHQTLNNEKLDNDVNVNMAISDIKYWCNDFLRLEKNINETSISPSHEIERKQNLINQILNK